MSFVKRYSLILVFEYKRVNNNIDAPKELYSMITDLKLAYDLSVNKFNIPKENITVITDVKSNDYPWLSNKCDKCNPNIKIINHPDISIITRNISQFIENTIRGIDETKKGADNNNEVFIYISGHGYQIENDIQNNTYINTLQLTNHDGSKSNFLKNDDIFKLLFGRVPIENDGSMLIPYMYREIKIDASGKMYYKYTEDIIKIYITPLSRDRSKHDNFITGCSPKLYNDLRGLPRDTQMFMIIDTCHSGKMVNFHYVYDADQKSMIVTHELPNSINTFPLCICLSATEENDTTLSTNKGSPFTRYIYNLFQNVNKPINISELYNLIYEKIPEHIKISKPCISSTFSNSNKYISIFEKYDYISECDLCKKE
jgi:hypothetical protein